MREWRNVGGEVWWFENIPVYLTLEVAVKKWLSSMNSSQPRDCSVAGPHRASAGVGEVVLTVGSRVGGAVANDADAVSDAGDVLGARTSQCLI